MIAFLALSEFENYTNISHCSDTSKNLLAGEAHSKVSSKTIKSSGDEDENHEKS